MRPLSIDGAWVADPKIYRDHRGTFREWYTATESGGFPLAQANCSTSVFGAVRGIHFTDVPPGQAKYVTCVSGLIKDVVVDVRVGSPTFGKWEAVRLDGDASAGVFLSEGLGHAWMALSLEATMVYLCSEPYTPAAERTISPLDPEIGIGWPVGNLVLSDKDRAAHTLEQMRAGGLLPRYSSCRKTLSEGA